MNSPRRVHVDITSTLRRLNFDQDADRPKRPFDQDVKVAWGANGWDRTAKPFRDPTNGNVTRSRCPELSGNVAAAGVLTASCQTITILDRAEIPGHPDRESLRGRGFLLSSGRQ
jgi:hypothetical protein